jgi:hypothetical protein
MKVPQLEENIRNIVRKKLSEANVLVTTKTGTKPVDYKNTTELSKLKSDPNVSSMETTAGMKIKESGTGDPNVSQMTREEMIDWLGMTPREGLKWTDGELRNAMYDMTQDIEQEPADDIDEADYFDVADNTIIEDDEFSDYDNIYERMKKLVSYKG